MLLSDSQIKNRGCVKGAEDENYKCSNYYLSIGTIFSLPKNSKFGRRISSQGSRKNTNYKIQPREMVWIVSNEILDLPPDITGVVTLVSRMTKKGLLALNAGIVDPTWQGPIGTILVNFSNREIELKNGDQFFRLLCMQHEKPENLYNSKYVPLHTEHNIEKSRDIYLKDVELNASKIGSSEFLDIESVSQEISRDMWSLTNPRTQGLIALFAFIVAVATAVPQLTTQGLRSFGLVDTPSQSEASSKNSNEKQ